MRICVYSGSNLGKHPVYAQAAAALGRALGQARFTLVYGGTTSGLMGVLADAAKASGARVIGVIPAFMTSIAHPGLDKLHVVPGMHERKALMAELADAFIALPGGIGTLEELLEVWTWRQLAFHQKPCALLNINGYYDKLLDFVKHAQQEAFICREHCQTLLVNDNPQLLLAALEQRNF